MARGGRVVRVFAAAVVVKVLEEPEVEDEVAACKVVWVVPGGLVVVSGTQPSIPATVVSSRTPHTAGMVKVALHATC